MIVKTASNIDLPRATVSDLHLFLPSNTASFYQLYLLLEHPGRNYDFTGDQIKVNCNVGRLFSCLQSPPVTTTDCHPDNRADIHIIFYIPRFSLNLISHFFPTADIYSIVFFNQTLEVKTMKWECEEVCRHKMRIILLIRHIWLFMISQATKWGPH